MSDDTEQIHNESIYMTYLRRRYMSMAPTGHNILSIEQQNLPYNAEILGDNYRRQVPLPRITDNRAQYSRCDPAHPSVQTFVTSVQTKLCQQKPEQLFVQLQRRTYLLNSYRNIRTQ